MSRSIWKKLFVDSCLLNSYKPINFMKKVWSRRSAITSVLIGKTVLIHNGKEFKKLLVKREHLGFKFGEFSLTKKFTKKNGDKKNKI